MGGKLKFIISDLHLGAGYAHTAGNRLEDFTADGQLVQFLQEIRQESDATGQEIELIINGDLFEFLQVPAIDSYEPQTRYPVDVYLDSSETASVKRLNVIIQGHQQVFKALSDFMQVEAPQRRITIIKGNHDVNLFWPGVKSRMREALGAAGPRASLLLFAEEFVSREGIYVEHGHQRTEKINTFLDFRDPRLPNQPAQLYYPPGSQFVIHFFNQVEWERWFIDSVKPLTTLIWYALRWDFDFAAKTLVNFIRYAPGLLVGSFAVGDAASSPAETLQQELADDDARRQMAEAYANDPVFRERLHSQIQQLLGNATAPSGQVEVTAFTVPAADSNPIVMGQTDQARQHSALHQAAEEIAQREGAKVILFGHTHSPLEEKLEAGGVYLNTGCWLWQEDFSDAPAETWEALFKGTQTFGDTAGRLPYARIDYDAAGQPAARLLDFAAKDVPFPVPVSTAPKNIFERILRWFTRLFGVE